MNNEPLHIKYRPQRLKDIVGNTEIVDCLEPKVKEDVKTLPHVYLFQGPSGCGKTTLARILAKELGCPTNKIQEINSANARGIEDARGIIATCKYLPASGEKVKVYILDEVHQATKDFQNALLKVLEDTPGHVYFMLCTTDPGKVLKAVRNRCSVYEVESLKESEIMELLSEVISKEKKLDKKVRKVKEGHLEMIADVCEGSPRQALILLDQILYVSKDKREQIIKDYRTMENQIIDLCRILLKKTSWKGIASILKGLSNENPESVRYAIMGYLNAVLLSRGDARTAYVLMNFTETNFMYSGKAGLSVTCYNASQDEV